MKGFDPLQMLTTVVQSPSSCLFVSMVSDWFGYSIQVCLIN